MSIQEIMSLGGSKISANVNFEDLKAFADYLIQKTKEEVEESILAKKKETFVKPKDACKQLQVDRSTLWRWAKTGYLIPAEVGGKRLYKQSEIDIILRKLFNPNPGVKDSVRYPVRYLSFELSRCPLVRYPGTILTTLNDI